MDQPRPPLAAAPLFQLLLQLQLLLLLLLLLPALAQSMAVDRPAGGGAWASLAGVDAAASTISGRVGSAPGASSALRYGASQHACDPPAVALAYQHTYVQRTLTQYKHTHNAAPNRYTHVHMTITTSRIHT